MIGRVGDDAFGQRLRNGLEENGVDVSHVLTTTDCASGLAIVAVEDSGENSIMIVPGANGRLTPADVLAASSILRDADIVLVQLEVPLETTIAAIQAGPRTRHARNPRSGPGPRTWRRSRWTPSRIAQSRGRVPE